MNQSGIHGMSKKVLNVAQLRDFTPLNTCKRLNVFGMDNFSWNNVDDWSNLAATSLVASPRLWSASKITICSMLIIIYNHRILFLSNVLLRAPKYPEPSTPSKKPAKNPWKRKCIYKPINFWGCHVSFRGCNYLFPGRVSKVAATSVVSLVLWPFTTPQTPQRLGWDKGLRIECLVGAWEFIGLNR